MTAMTNAVSQTYWQSAGLPHLQLRETRHSTHAYKAHSHATFSIGAVTGGVTRLTLAQESSLLLAQGELVLIGPDCVHSCNPVDGRPRSYLMLYVDADWLLTLARQWFGPQTAAVCFTRLQTGDVALYRQFMTFVELFRNDQPLLAEQALKQMLRALISSDKQIEGHDDWRTRQIRQTFYRRLDDPPSLSTLAGQYHVRPETLIRTFKQQTGLSPKAWLNNLRIERAKRLLENGSTSSEVAYHLGFADQSHFQKTFLAYAALTPGQYRRGVVSHDQ